MPARWDWPLSTPLRIQVQGREIAWNPDPKSPRLPALPAVDAKPVESLTLVPYGCTKFRVAMFPVTAGPEVEVAAIRRVLFLGNSITLHGPKPDIGWNGAWGMAASAEDKDYVHLVAAALARHTGVVPDIRVRNIADFERGFGGYDVETELKDVLAFDPDLVVLAIGENVPALVTPELRSRFREGVVRLLSATMARRHPRLVVRGSFWADATKDEILRDACREAGGAWVDAGELGRDPANAARSERSWPHDGVAAHPGDRGMRALADAVIQGVLAGGAKK